MIEQIRATCRHCGRPFRIERGGPNGWKTRGGDRYHYDEPEPIPGSVTNVFRCDKCGEVLKPAEVSQHKSAFVVKPRR